MITANESQSIFDIGKYYVVLPNDDLIQSKGRKKYLKFKKFKSMKYGFSYFSENNPDFLSLKDLTKIIKKYLKK